MNASKEEASKAKQRLRQIINELGVLKNTVEMYREELLAFLEEAERKLPSEAAYTMSDLDSALKEAGQAGLLDRLTEEIHQDTVNAFCDAVASCCGSKETAS